MEVQLVTQELEVADAWTLAELLVLFGWLSTLVTCCAGLCCLAKWFHGHGSPRQAKRVVEMAGIEKKKVAEAATQTVLCSPPFSLREDTVEGQRVGSSTSWEEDATVYSTYKRKGQEALLKDMVVRALPIVENLDQRRRRANNSEM